MEMSEQTQRLSLEANEKWGGKASTHRNSTRERLGSSSTEQRPAASPPSSKGDNYRDLMQEKGNKASELMVPQNWVSSRNKCRRSLPVWDMDCTPLVWCTVVYRLGILVSSAFSFVWLF